MISFNVLMFGIIRVFFLIVVIFAILILIRMYIVFSVDTFDAETEIIYNRFLYSVNGISYYDYKINRLYPGIIDVKRLDSSILNKSADFGEDPHIGAMFVLKNIRKEVKKTVFYNKVLYEEKIRLFRGGMTEGPGGARAVKKENYVLYRDNDGSTKQGFLEVEIVIPNS